MGYQRGPYNEDQWRHRPTKPRLKTHQDNLSDANRRSGLVKLVSLGAMYEIFHLNCCKAHWFRPSIFFLWENMVLMDFYWICLCDVLVWLVWTLGEQKMLQTMLDTCIPCGVCVSKSLGATYVGLATWRHKQAWQGQWHREFQIGNPLPIQTRGTWIDVASNANLWDEYAEDFLSLC